MSQNAKSALYEVNATLIKCWCIILGSEDTCKCNCFHVKYSFPGLIKQCACEPWTVTESVKSLALLWQPQEVERENMCVLTKLLWGKVVDDNLRN